MSPTLKEFRTACDSEEAYNSVKFFVSLSRSGESLVSSCTQKCPGFSKADTNTSKKSSFAGNCTTPVVGEAKRQKTFQISIVSDVSAPLI